MSNAPATNLTFAVRRLGRGDVGAFRELNRLFAEAFDDAVHYQQAPPSDAYLQALLAKPHVIALVTLVEGKMAGGLVAYVLDKFEKERSEVYIYDLAVLEQFRRRGIARSLIVELKKIAADIGAWVIYVQADKNAEDFPARQLYESMGEREDVFHYDIAID
ncbi:GNAT family N-acetyltransferase [Turneriella parva]|uniref:GCN5-related N-acetyltransferase n=1 Tax=Turneriella parva (strain ATCC BAA-1111 / DSM 21527 / NCTC 11395 / H) TaxID=869212 RepID=I4B2R4_TURPD|nr:GNAT family N-acetyltransferase [Turneriella parva]AFM11571.1 GCN5-related N-acetyltransferase [Turneriella parva DSM 21527]